MTDERKTESAVQAPAPAEFDYAGLDEATAEKLRGITDCVLELYQSYAWGMAYQVGRAHDLLCGPGTQSCETVSQLNKESYETASLVNSNSSCETVSHVKPNSSRETVSHVKPDSSRETVSHVKRGRYSENTFAEWCRSVGIERRSAYNLLNAYQLICRATPEQQKNLQTAPARLLYEAGRKDAPAELADAVLDGDITTHKQYQTLLADLNAERTARAKAEQAAAESQKRIRGLEESYRTAHANEECTLKNLQQAKRAQDEAEKALDTVTKERDGARQALAAARLRGDKLKAENDDLRARPIEAAAAVIDEGEVARRAAALADEKAEALAEPLRRQIEALQESRANADRDADDAILLLGRQINTAWQLVRPFLAAMPEDKRIDAIDRINREWAQTQEEVMLCL